jgi:hypothetical protein
MLILVMTYVLIFSFIPHKEDRFLLPIIPFVFMILFDFIIKIMR